MEDGDGGIEGGDGDGGIEDRSRIKDDENASETCCNRKERTSGDSGSKKAKDGDDDDDLNDNFDNDNDAGLANRTAIKDPYKLRGSACPEGTSCCYGSQCSLDQRVEAPPLNGSETSKRTNNKKTVSRVKFSSVRFEPSARVPSGILATNFDASAAGIAASKLPAKSGVMHERINSGQALGQNNWTRDGI